jgi:hypothetical protein
MDPQHCLYGHLLVFTLVTPDTYSTVQSMMRKAPMQTGDAYEDHRNKQLGRSVPDPDPLRSVKISSVQIRIRSLCSSS